MSACEKCWRDAGGDYSRYTELLAERASNPCTPEEQRGEFRPIVEPTPYGHSMLPNASHPGPGCSCRECLRAHP